MSSQAFPVRRPLGRALLLPLLLLGVGLAVAAVWLIVATFQQQLSERVRMRAGMVASAVNYTAETVSGTTELQRIVTAMGAEDEVNLIVVAGGQPARVLASTRRAWLGKTLAQLPDQDVAEDIATAVKGRVSRGHFHRETSEYGFVMPLLFSQPEIADRSLTDGAVMVRLDLRGIRAAMRQLATEFAAAFLVVLVALGALGYARVRRHVLRPLARIGTLLESEPQGGAGWAAAMTADELGALAHTLDDALTRAAAARRALEEQSNALRDAEARYRLLFEQSPDGIVILDQETGRIQEFNTAAHRQLGYSREEFAQLSIADIEAAETPAETRAHIGTVLSAGRDAFETRQRTRQGEVRDVHVTSQVITVLGRSVFHSIWRDITAHKRADAERERLQAQLSEAQKMESVGRLAGGVAHEFNNLLMGMMSYVELCRDGLAPEHPIRAYLDEIMRDAQRSADIAKQLLAFARKQTIAPQLLDLNEAVAGALELLRGLLGEDIDLAWLPGAGLWPVTMDPTQLDQILATLAANARDAISGVGKLTVETANTTLDETFCAGRAEALPGEYVLLAVSDSGRGMAPETLTHLFEPFFTTKGLASGTGLGLATVYGIVRQNRGCIDVTSAPGQGTTLRIYLPRAKVAAAAAPTSARPAAPAGRAATILLVEDERSVRLTVGRFLEAMGHTVLAAAGPDEALRLAGAHPGEIHLLITDVVMPGLSGSALAQQLRSQRPALKCLFMSGYSADALAERGRPSQDAPFLAKPFSRESLTQTVRALLAEDGPARGPA